MNREEILKKTQLSPKAFCPGCWHHVKKLLRLFEDEEPSDELLENVVDVIGIEISSGDTTAVEELLKFVPTKRLKAYLPEQRQEKENA